MRAAVLHEFKSPFKIEDVELKNLQGVKVRVKYTAICGRDVVIRKGGFRNLKLPLIL
ncbi:MAG: alcohol dehydrogenase, partial [Sulfolobales archaeon]